ncbi:MAG: response regulator [Zetaproteobacteria bacterium]|nr:response regulator [Zetaproteobacteria bacterium]
MDNPSKLEVNLLLVEDDADVLQIVRDLVEDAYNFTSIHTASDGQLAKDIIEKYPINMIISDITMPNMTGIELLKWLNEKNLGYILTVMLTGQATLENSIQALKYGAFDFLVKPVESDELQAAIDLATEEIDRRQALKLDLSQISHIDIQKLLEENEFHIQCVEDGSFLKTSISCLCRNLVKFQQSVKGVEFLADQMLLDVYKMRLNADNIGADKVKSLKECHKKIASIFRQVAT